MARTTYSYLPSKGAVPNSSRLVHLHLTEEPSDTIHAHKHVRLPTIKYLYDNVGAPIYEVYFVVVNLYLGCLVRRLFLSFLRDQNTNWTPSSRSCTVIEKESQKGKTALDTHSNLTYFAVHVVAPPFTSLELFFPIKPGPITPYIYICAYTRLISPQHDLLCINPLNHYFNGVTVQFLYHVSSKYKLFSSRAG